MDTLIDLPPLPPKLEALREEMAAEMRVALKDAKLDDTTKLAVRDIIARFHEAHADRFEEAYREAETLGFTAVEFEEPLNLQLKA